MANAEPARKQTPNIILQGDLLNVVEANLGAKSAAVRHLMEPFVHSPRLTAMVSESNSMKELYKPLVKLQGQLEERNTVRLKKLPPTNWKSGLPESVPEGEGKQEMVKVSQRHRNLVNKACQLLGTHKDSDDDKDKDDIEDLKTGIYSRKVGDEKCIMDKLRVIDRHDELVRQGLTRTVAGVQCMKEFPETLRSRRLFHWRTACERDNWREMSHHMKAKIRRIPNSWKEQAQRPAEAAFGRKPGWDLPVAMKTHLVDLMKNISQGL